MFKFSTLLSSAILIATPALLAAQTLSQTDKEIESKLADALSRLSSARAEIRDEKVPLSRKLNELQAEIKTLDKEAERIDRLRENSNFDLTKMQESVKARQEEIQFASNLLLEYARGLETRASIAELSTLEPLIDESLLAADVEDGTGLNKQAEIMMIGLDRAKELVGGQIIQGEAILPTGAFEDGKFILFGPITYFSSDKSGLGGIAQRGASSEPSVVDIGIPDADESIATLASSKSGKLPVDSTIGNAIALASTEETIPEHIAKGGIWVYPILGFALLATMVAGFKALEIYSIKRPADSEIGKLFSAITSADQEKALHIANAMPGPLGKMFQAGSKNIFESKETVEEVLYEEMLETKPKINRMLPFIAVTAATAPLMGLLGTVTGMINTFKLITIFGTGDAKSLSSGISEALITTEFGLIVAIPALIMHAILSRRAGAMIGDMEKSGVAFINALPKKEKSAS
ncbi:MotA/TolQ/ExbB proton channel family protein [Pelagicoccus albus]|uniref:MotA/TolQ/ExbB proton channel family protein n=1 Tax=Pelagicoccus albus TaxID=415222 RepID=A0A7X1B952_9BACT|nr:MotA/TolQ/ExbB proton channel family protein [Pelagicoccus albus]MBC2607958.1 MotA/TolQ/ExbB proton channel family protein [Pelagicoccus albus]